MRRTNGQDLDFGTVKLKIKCLMLLVKKYTYAKFTEGWGQIIFQQIHEKNYPRTLEAIFRPKWIILSTDWKEKLHFPSFLLSWPPRSKANFSRKFFQLLIVYFPKIWFLLIFLKVKTTSSVESNNSNRFFTSTLLWK